MDRRQAVSLAIAAAAGCGTRWLRAAEPTRTILAIGAHCGDMEITTGAVLAAEQARGRRIVLLHLTLGEGGHPKKSPREYGDQKRQEARAAAQALGAEVRFAPWHDGELPNTEESRRWVANQIRAVKPDTVFTHWRHSLHRDHSNTHAIVVDAVLLAALPGVELEHPPYRGVRAVWYAENWEDREGFQPYLYVDVTASLPRWKQAVEKYELFRGGVVSYPYLDYYESLARVRGAESGKKYAVAFDIEPYQKKRVFDVMP